MNDWRREMEFVLLSEQFVPVSSSCHSNWPKRELWQLYKTPSMEIETSLKGFFPIWLCYHYIDSHFNHPLLRQWLRSTSNWHDAGVRGFSSLFNCIPIFSIVGMSLHCALSLSSCFFGRDLTLITPLGEGRWPKISYGKKLVLDLSGHWTYGLGEIAAYLVQ